MLMSESLTLFRLQKLDTEIDQSRSRLAEIERLLSDDRRLTLANKSHEKAQQNLKDARVKLNLIEGKVEAQRIKRKNSQNALFSGNIKNPKELQDLQMETEALQRYIAQLEDEQLEAMINHESAEEEYQLAENELNHVKALLIQENAVLVGEQSKLNDTLSRLLREKEAALQATSQNNQILYNQLRERKRGVAVVSIVDGGCGICGQAITPADLQAVRSSSGLVFCSSCGRILYEG
ncbi:MAG TPA: C4-type zinc ribbon domain-containing protein [Brevefilum sp.]|nr:C4-type zinc ribbon domain-containing protein [Brevefilum sp.]